MTEPNDAADRRRAYRITARLLREYTARVNRLGNRLGEFLDGHSRAEPNGMTPELGGWCSYDRTWLGGPLIPQSTTQAPRVTDADGKRPRLSWEIARAIDRYTAIRQPFRSIALFASQMLVHYDLDPAEACELRLRLADAENAIDAAQALAEIVARAYNLNIDIQGAPNVPAAQRG